MFARPTPMNGGTALVTKLTMYFCFSSNSENVSGVLPFAFFDGNFHRRIVTFS